MVDKLNLVRQHHRENAYEPITESVYDVICALQSAIDTSH